VHPRQAEVARHPQGHLGAGPAPAIVGRRLQALGERRQQRRGQHARGPAVAPSLVAQSLRAVRVVARGQLLHPARRERQHPSHLQHRSSLRQQPDRLGVPRLGRIPYGPVTRLQLFNRQVPDDPRHGPAPKPRTSAYPS